MLTPSVRGDLSPEGKFENGGVKRNDVCAHRVERSAVGRKNRLELGQGIGEDGETQQLSEPNAGQASQNPEAATEEPEPAASGAAQEDIGGSGERNGETNGRTRRAIGCSGSSSARNGVKLRNGCLRRSRVFQESLESMA